MSRSEQVRLADILHAIERCQNYTPHLGSEDLRAMAYDAVLRNLAVIGEAVRALPWPTVLYSTNECVGSSRAAAAAATLSRFKRRVCGHPQPRLDR